ncbi:hypothetical protein D8674_003208 [Pyrus ussuriensis x Pyrus communis]|uniref:Uncharacterized protein n=1 Tax=Pyrus ussuriensis x Pyrus communis TaxID=2448454 RepID=A0A5N5FH34_9ROSA|nr:hypothetical protein D8674_003208 [Pyrus ussuriensis x Pyrus communis]
MTTKKKFQAYVYFPEEIIVSILSSPTLSQRHLISVASQSLHSLGLEVPPFEMILHMNAIFDLWFGLCVGYYKLLVADLTRNFETVLYMEMFSLRANSWKSIHVPEHESDESRQDVDYFQYVLMQ